MRVVVLDSPQEVSCRAAELFCQTIRSRPNSVLGLATGGTPLGTYNALVERYRAGEVSFAQCTSFNLDEYVGLGAEHEQSYASFMRKNFFDRVDIPHARCFLPDGTAKDLQAAALAYEAQVAEAGGIDLQLLGVGSDGHIAFNEPGSSLASRTRIKALTERTRRDNARFFSSIDEVPRLSITMGVGSILDARRILLIATGSNKASAVRALIEGPLTAQVPASALQLHPHATVVLDQEAASWLTRIDYYREVEHIQCEIEASIKQ